jgi:hypothetical protein
LIPSPASGNEMQMGIVLATAAVSLN